MKFNILPLLLLFIIASVNLYAQVSSDTQFSVIRIKGKVFNISQSNKEITRGDKIKATDQLRFATKDSKIRVIAPRHGTFDIGLEQSKTEKESELMAFVKNVLLPLPNTNSLSLPEQ